MNQELLRGGQSPVRLGAEIGRWAMQPTRTAIALLARLLLAIGMAVAIPSLTRAHPADAILATADGNLRSERLQEARAAYQAAIDAYRPDARDVEVRRSLVMALAGLGRVLTELAQYNEAAKPLAEGLAIAQESDQTLSEEREWLLSLDGLRALQYGDYEAATRRCADDRIDRLNNSSKLSSATRILTLYCASNLEAQSTGNNRVMLEWLEAAFRGYLTESNYLVRLDGARLAGALAQVQTRRGSWAKLEETIKFGSELCTVQGGTRTLCATYFRQSIATVNIALKRFALAWQMLDEAEEVARGLLDDAHPLFVAMQLARARLVLDQREKFDDAERLTSAAMAIGRKRLLPAHYYFLIAQDNLFLSHIGRMNWDEGERAALEAIKIREAQVASNHPSLADRLENIARLNRNLARDLNEPHRIQRAEEYERRAERIRRESAR